jgi:hypothetical protein
VLNEQCDRRRALGASASEAQADRDRDVPRAGVRHPHAVVARLGEPPHPTVVKRAPSPALHPTRVTPSHLATPVHPIEYDPTPPIRYGATWLGVVAVP